MAIAQVASVTQSTSPTANATTQTDSSAWREAMTSTKSNSDEQQPVEIGSHPATPKQTDDGGSADSKETDVLEAPPGLSTHQDNKAEDHNKKASKDSSGAVLNSEASSGNNKKSNTPSNVALVVSTAITDVQNLSIRKSASSDSTAPVKATGAAKTIAAESQTTPPDETSSSTTIRAEVITNSESEPLPAETVRSSPAKPQTAPASTKSPKRETSATAMQSATASPAPQAPSTSDALSINVESNIKDAGTASQGSTKSSPSSTSATPAPTASTAQILSARIETMATPSGYATDQKEKGRDQQTLSLSGVTASQQPIFSADSTNAISQPNSVASTGNVSASASALAATVTALHQSGQNGTILRLDPPGLGHLSVQVGLGTQGQVNVLFVPSSADAAQLLQSALPQLGNAMAQSGLTLGQAQVGGQFSQNAGQGGQNGYTPPRQNNASTFTADAQTPASGLSAYA